jgi:non-specific serine/threonine protein kinase
VALLLARTQALNPRFQLTDGNAADLAAICVQLDGLPLAIELAAARLKLLAPHDLLRRIDHRLTLLTTGARDLPPLHQTLHATIEWSYWLLDPTEQRLFADLSVFSGGWSLVAAEAVCATPGTSTTFDAPVLDGLAALVDKSLVQQHVADDGTVRFSMLERHCQFEDWAAAAARVYVILGVCRPPQRRRCTRASASQPRSSAMLSGAPSASPSAIVMWKNCWPNAA